MNMTPKEIVSYLDDYVIGQNEAKKTIALALRNRYRRMQLSQALQDEIMPKNILMIGSTGIGKTEIARRLAKMMNLPFVKVEASKYTEVGYVGRDVESMIRDLVFESHNIVKKEFANNIESDIELEIQKRIIDILIPPLPESASQSAKESFINTYNVIEKKLIEKKLDDKKISIEVPISRQNEVFDTGSPMDFTAMSDSLNNLLKGSKQDKIKKEVTIKEAKIIFHEIVSELMLDQDAIKREALARAQDGGIVFLDEIDKIASGNNGKNQDPSKEGVQRDLLPIVEGSTVHTKFGQIKTDHILFIAAGAFHVSRPSDMLPELQGRFPLRVELNPLKEEDLYQILTKTKNSLLTQYKALLGVEGVELVFNDDAIRSFAFYSVKANEKTEDIGARRLHTALEKVLENISYDANEHNGEKIIVDKILVENKLKNIVDDEDISRYIL